MKAKTWVEMLEQMIASGVRIEFSYALSATAEPRFCCEATYRSGYDACHGPWKCLRSTPSTGDSIQEVYAEYEPRFRGKS